MITDPNERRPLIEAAASQWGRTDVAEMLQYSPLIVFDVHGALEIFPLGRDHPSIHGAAQDSRRPLLRTRLPAR